MPTYEIANIADDVYELRDIEIGSIVLPPTLATKAR